jgi:16S rRNA (guanine527-N7)-methyltransferase
MKGVYPDEELALLPTDVSLIVAIPLQVPGLKAARHLVLLRLA